MKYLKTKADRLNMRQQWINGRETIKYKDIEYLAGETTKGERTVFTLTLWRGSEGSPSVNYYYSKQQQRDDSIEYYKKGADDREEYNRKKKEPKPELVHNLKKGDLFFTSWGYDQTNYDYIVIMSIKGKYALCQRTSSIHLGESGQSNVQEPIFCPFGDTFKMKIQGGCNGGISLRGSYPFLQDGKISVDESGYRHNLRLDTFSPVKQGETFHETMAGFGH